jgi:citronellol/citronellal dehydrogenase
MDESVANVFAPDLMTGRRCLITGGGTGIGLETARILSGLGARLALLGRRVELLEEAARTLDTEVVIRACDIREPEAVEETVAAVCDELGGIDVLVNNAGGQFPAPAETISAKGFEAVVRNNLFGTWNMTRAVAARAMIPQKGGAIVNVIANIERGFPGMVHTGAARAGVENMTRTLAIEWVSHDVRVNAVAPGVIDTPVIAKYGPELLTMVKKAIPMKRFGSAAEVARCIVFLCSPAASYVTGETLYIDGGARLWGETWPIADRD